MTPPEAFAPPDGPAFEQPWQAKAFAMTVLLIERGLFTWSEWTTCLARNLEGGTAGAGRVADAYYRGWIRALEEIATARGLVDPAVVEALAAAWRNAAQATPHGRAIALPDEARALAAAG